MKCPTCGKLFGPEIYQCGQGHSACKACKTAEKNCGQCMQELTSTRNYSLEEYLQNMNIKAPCRNKEDGCILKFKTEQEVEDHLKECLYNTIACPSKGFAFPCHWEGKVSQITRHFLSTHPEIPIAKVDQELVLNLDLPENSRQMYLIEMGMYKFLVNLRLDKTECYITMTVHIFATSLNASMWYFELHIYNKREHQRKLMFTDACKPYMMAEDEDTTSCIIPLSAARTFYNETIKGINYKIFVKMLVPKKGYKTKNKKLLG